MKNKTLTYILLIVVALIWYKVFFRISGNLLNNEPDTILTSNQTSMVNISKRDTFDIQANYRDPFGENKVAEPIIAERSQELPPIIRRPPVKTAWPPIIYYGQVKKTSSNHPLAILKVDGMQLMLRKGDELFDGIILKEVSRDSIRIRYKKETRTFKRY